MAIWSRVHLIKATVLVGIFLLLLNVYNYLLVSTRMQNIPTALSILSPSYAQWPKRTHTHDPDIRMATSNVRHNNTGGGSPRRPQHTQSINSSALPTLDDSITPTEDSGPSTRSSILQTIISSSSSNKVVSSTPGMRECPAIPPNLNGPITVNTTADPLAVLEQRLAATLLAGGWHRPADCVARDRVAIVVPYRERADHLPVFLANLHPLLQKQQIDYGLFVVEQATGSQFNRAALLNVGFVEAMKLAPWDCFIFHDLDLLPLDDRNLYTCPDQPRHMSVAVDTLGFKLPYSSIFGGVSALTAMQFKRVNGFSNSFWGWGGEDDDMSNRLRNSGYHIARYPVNIARYTMLYHKKEKANPKRYENLVSGAKRFDVDGLNSVRYKVLRLEKKVLYTWIEADIIPESAS